MKVTIIQEGITKGRPGSFICSLLKYYPVEFVRVDGDVPLPGQRRGVRAGGVAEADHDGEVSGFFV